MSTLTLNELSTLRDIQRKLANIEDHIHKHGQALQALQGEVAALRVLYTNHAHDGAEHA